MRLLFLGDVVGRPGRHVITDRLPQLRERWRLDCVVINGENAAGGFGLTEAICEELLQAGADAVTLGNHSFDQREALVFIARQSRLVRPANYPPGTPGRGSTVVDVPGGRKALVVNAMGRLFMEPLDDPFRAVQGALAAHRLGAGGGVQAVLVDIHAEASSEKMAMAHSFDGRASLVIGTHTHVPSGDYRILEGGTAYMTDAGMCGDYDSVIGMQKGPASLRFWKKVPGEKLAPAEGPASLSGLFVETDDATGLALRLAPVRLGGKLSQAMPDF